MHIERLREIHVPDEGALTIVGSTVSIPHPRRESAEERKHGAHRAQPRRGSALAKPKPLVQHITPLMDGPVICPICGERVGVYEPTAVIEADGARLTSLAREPELRGLGISLLHAACATAQPMTMRGRVHGRRMGVTAGGNRPAR
jgi:hypothetical protein